MITQKIANKNNNKNIKGEPPEGGIFGMFRSFEEDPFVIIPSFVDITTTLIYDPESWEWQIASELSHRVSDEWLLQVSSGSIKLVLLTPFENVSVQRTITWNGKEAKVFIHNKELQGNSFVMNVEPPQQQDETCDYLAKLSHLVLNSSVCKGVRLYREEWQRAVEHKEAYMESQHYQEIDCLRHNQCSLILNESDVCATCHKMKNTLKQRHWRKGKENDQDKDKSKVNIRYLSAEETKERLKQLIEERKKLKLKMFTLKRSLERFVKRNSIEVGSELSEDLAKIFKNNYNNLSRTQKLFWGEQMKALSRQKDLRGMRWNPFVIRLALRIQMMAGPKAYDSLQHILFLPSQRRLYDFTHFTEAKEGPQEAILQALQRKVREECKEEHEKYFNLLFDEMDVRSDIVIRKNTGEVVGFTNLSPVELEIEKLEKEMMDGEEFKPLPAKKVLVFMVQGVTNSVQEVVGIFTSSGAMTASHLYSRVWQVVYRCESYGLKILCLIADGASVNKKFFSMHSQFSDPDMCKEDLPPQDTGFVYCTRNIACNEWRPIFFLIDPPHLLKTLRNCFANSYAHKKTRNLWKDGEDISWTTLEALLYIIIRSKYSASKLTRSHIKLTSYSCMKVLYAAQTASNSTVEALKNFKDHEKLSSFALSQLMGVLKIINDWFDCLNGGGDEKSLRYIENQNLHPFQDINDPRLLFLVDTVLGFFEDWRQSTLTRPGSFKKEQREKMFISFQSYESLKVTNYGFVYAVKYMLRLGAPKVIAKVFNSDKIEQYFGMLRMSFGGNRNPTVSLVTQKVLDLHVQGQVKLAPKKGNTEVDLEEKIDETPLPQKRKK